MSWLIPQGCGGGGGAAGGAGGGGGGVETAAKQENLQGHLKIAKHETTGYFQRNIVPAVLLVWQQNSCCWIFLMRNHSFYIFKATSGQFRHSFDGRLGHLQLCLWWYKQVFLGNILILRVMCQHKQNSLDGKPEHIQLCWCW